jgi:hypothetical protein
MSPLRPLLLQERRQSGHPRISHSDGVRQINDEEGVKWLFSFLRADMRKTFCLNEAPNAEAIRIAAKRANLPADVITEISGEIRPEMFA